jgi:hypothetical protein
VPVIAGAVSGSTALALVVKKLRVRAGLGGGLPQLLVPVRSHLDMLVGAYNFLDPAPKGRGEDGLSFTMEWVRHHDRYGD